MSKDGTKPPEDTTGHESGQPDSNEEKKFTQADVDRIVSQRTARDKDKVKAYDDLMAQAKTDAEKQADKIRTLEAEVEASRAADARRAAAVAAKLPPELADLVTGTTDEEIVESVKKVQAAFESTGGKPPYIDRSQGKGPSQGPPAETIGEVRDRFLKKYSPTTT
ncbi:MAG: DUF4355 domain-containing protein [Propionibacteriaceae bacterium]|nr:DUF4355 domain-containing protein [Propionibacteriaceae bacterium]